MLFKKPPHHDKILYFEISSFLQQHDYERRPPIPHTTDIIMPLRHASAGSPRRIDFTLAIEYVKSTHHWHRLHRMRENSYAKCDISRPLGDEDAPLNP